MRAHISIGVFYGSVFLEGWRSQKKMHDICIGVMLISEVVDKLC